MRTALFAAAIAMLGCKGKPKHRPPPANLTEVDPRAKPTASLPANAPDIVLPHGNGKPPVKTTEPLPLKTLLAVQQMTYKGFQNQPHAINPDRGTEVTYLTEDKPRIAATITIAPCSEQAVLGACVPINLGTWTAKTGELKKMVPSELRDRPDTKFEVGVVKFHDTDLVYTFQLGQINGVKTTGSAAGLPFIAYTYAYILYYNDGHNQIRVVAEFKEEARQTPAEMTAEVPRADLAATATAFFDATTQLW
jgi:hypothetical protein